MNDPAPGSAVAIEQNGINVIAEGERRGRPRSLFWPWSAANISVLGISYGSFMLGFGLSWWQGALAGVLGAIGSFLLVGLVSLAGRRGSAPTMVLSRAAFGVQGNAVPAAISYLLLVGWETVLVALATLATSTVLDRLGLPSGTGTKVIAFIIVAAVIVAVGILGFDAIMRVQTVLTVGLAILTVGYMALTASHIHPSRIGDLPGAGFSEFLGALVLAATGFGLGWVNSAADYSRYLPRNSSGRAIVGWTTLGGSIAPVILIVWGVLLAGSSDSLNGAIAGDPIGALTRILPTWYLVPFVIVAVGGLVAGAVLDIYSSGLVLLTLGLRVQRWKAAGIDGVIMIAGTIYVVFFATDFIGPFQGFLITLGVPITAWCGVFLADLMLRRGPYVEADLYRAGRYGVVNPVSLFALVVATVVGLGLVTNTLSDAFSWQGYLLDPVGLGPKTGGTWSGANLGVIVAFVIGFGGYAASRVGGSVAHR
ncbi:MAG TPA: cytosine permease [Mycobacteriales bacterium]|nr:cytosine permease [Mycobacteriales bacterium]